MSNWAPVTVGTILVFILLFASEYFKVYSFNEDIRAIVCVLFPLVGVFAATKCSGIIKKIGVIGNGFILLSIVIIPFIMVVL